jgi:ABC-type dipeptide/oligopeptide/nickel transport system permease component
VTRFVLRRLAQLPLLLLAVYTLAFALAWAVPGSPFEDAEGRRPSREAQAAMRAQYRLDDPAGFYLDYLGRASGVSWAMGRSDRPFDLGPSLRHPDRSVNEIIADGFPISMTIGILAMLLIVVAMAFKISAAPFHMWTPDAYEGAPTSTMAYMSSVVKAAAFGAFARVMLAVYGDAASAGSAAGWPAMLAWVAVATMTVGNLVALTQTSVKRMLAYSSIAQSGYLLVGIIAFSHLFSEPFYALN